MATAPTPSFVVKPAQLAIAALAAVFLAYEIVVVGLANRYQESNPRRALAWNANDPDALVRLARSLLDTRIPRSKDGAAVPADQRSARNLSAQTLNEIAEASTRALSVEPSLAPALANLALVEEGRNQPDRARALMDLAYARNLRDTVAQNWLLEDSLRRQDFRKAVATLDTMLRTREAFPEIQAYLSILTALAVFPPAMPAVAEALSRQPLWRANFFGALLSAPAKSDALERLYTIMDRLPNAPTLRETQPYIDMLVKDQKYEQAHRVWAASMAQPGAADATLFNADFQFPASGAGFDWALQSARGADVAVRGAPPEPRTLNVEFSGARVGAIGVSHLLYLAPGNYVFSGEAYAPSLQTPVGLTWTLTCVGPARTILATTPAIRSAPNWSPFEATIVVPGTACGAQALRLELPARVALEQQISGEIAFRQLKIERRS